MAQKKNKVTKAHDGIVQPEHIDQARRAMGQIGLDEMLKRISQLEPEMASFIAAASKDIAAGAMIDSDMTRVVAQRLRDRTAVLATKVFRAYNFAVYDFYKELVKGTPAAALDAELNVSPPPTPSPPPSPEGSAGAS